MGPSSTARRSRELDDIAEALPQRAAALSQLFLTRTSVRVSRIEAAVLWALALRPRRITELAAREGVTQPAVTSLINRLEARGWVQRHRDPHDARAVLVALTDHGRAVRRQMRSEYRALLHEEMATLQDGDVRTLARAIEILDALIERITGAGPVNGSPQPSPQSLDRPEVAR
ncbi:MAG: MarR family winged helix-turn-helix transcriptional regulator [Trebonia sp.]